MSDKIRVYELKKELDLDIKDILAICHQLDIRVKSHSSSITSSEAEEIRLAAQKIRKNASVEQNNLLETEESLNNSTRRQQILEIRKNRIVSVPEKDKSRQSYKWSPIEDLPENWQELASEELEKLAGIWDEQAKALKESDALQKFNSRLTREWAIETGILENLYSIDRGTTQILIERGIEASLIAHGATDKPPEYIIPILKAQQDALEGVFAFVKQSRDLSVH